MANLASVKSRIQAEPMDITELQEDGEIFSSDDETGEKKGLQSDNIFSKYNNKDTGFVSSVGLFDEEENRKKIERAKRFALANNELSSKNISSEDFANLYRSLGIDKENERHYRFNTIHMRGTQDMSTDDVFEYFISYGPSNIEWVNDVSCNVVWMDDVSAARALWCLSKEIKNLDKVHLNADPFEKDLKEKEMDTDNIDDSEIVDARNIKVAIPPGFWRIGVPSPKSDTILLRYATRSDKKPKNAERLSEYYKKHGNPHFGNTPGVLSKTKREGLFQKKRRKDDDFLQEDQVMEDKKNPWGDLAQTWASDEEEENKSVNYKKPILKRTQPNLKRSQPYQGPDLRQSLNKKQEKQVKQVKHENSDDSDSSDHWERKRKVPRMKMYADEEEKKKEANVKNEVIDLRSKINRKKVISKTKQSVLQRAEPSRLSEDSDEDKDSGDWALEHYNDLRESIEQNKKQKREASRIRKYDVEESEDDDDDDDEDFYEKDINHRSPLQIEIDNDEYYRNKEQSDSD